MKFLDLFAGIGGFRMGLESLGHECVGFCEIDKFARKSYKAIYKTEGEVELHDITAVTNEEWRKFRGTVDIICGGFPCQAFSIAGKRKGFLDETRGTLFFEIARAAKEIKPPLLFIENVKGLLSHDQGRTFRTILSTLDELGYDAEWQILNSKDYGVPQNRERVFIIGHLRGKCGRQVFPIRGDGTAIDCEQPKINKVGNIRKNGKSQSGIVVSTDSLAPTLCSTTTQKDPLKVAIPIKTDTAQYRHGIVIAGNLPGLYEQSGRVYDTNGISPTIRTMQGGGLEPKICVREATNFRIRKLTPRECWRLQGFPDWAFDKAQEVNSNSQLYKQAGNSVTVNVIKAIGERLEE